MPQLRLKQLLIGKFTWTRLVRSLLLIYILLAVYIFFRADSMIFLPHAAGYEDTEKILKISTAAGEKISAIYLPNPQARYTLLYIHGNAEDLGDIHPLLTQLNAWGFSVFAYDYRGYGTSDGKPSESHAYQDAEAVYQYLTRERQIPADRIIVYGRSVGGGSAVELAMHYSIAGLILESTFTSIFRVVVPIPLLPFDKFDNLRKLQQVRCPVLVMHGQADQTIPFWHGQKLYDAAPEPKLSLWLEGAGHNDFALVAGDRLPKALNAFQRLIEQSSP